LSHGGWNEASEFPGPKKIRCRIDSSLVGAMHV
jgi:hypothetical protein